MDLNLDQAKDIIGNPENPHHSAFHSNINPDVVQAVNRAFEQAFPGEMELGGLSPGTQALFEQAAGKSSEPPQQSQTSAELSPEIQTTIQTVESDLRAEWGSKYQEELEVAKSAA